MELLLLLGGGLLLASMMGGKKLDKMTINGHEWLVEQSPTSFIIYAPKGAYGPHLRMPIVQVRKADRVLLARYPGVPPLVYQMAMADFQVNDPNL